MLNFPNPLPQSVRVATLLPPPLALSDYAPFAPLSFGAFGHMQMQDVSAASYAALVKCMERAFKAGSTAGYCPVASVKAVFFDMDSTVIAEESIVELAGFAGKADEVSRITERAMQGELDFKESLLQRVATLRGLPESIFAQVGERLTLMRGIQPFAAFCREINLPLYLVSGGFVQLASIIQRKVGFTAIRANVLEVVDGKLTGQVIGEIIDGDAKERFLRETCQGLGIDPRTACAVGDGANDIKMMDAAGVAVGFCPKPVLLPHLHALNAIGNHAFLGPLLFGRDLSITRSKLASW